MTRRALVGLSGLRLAAGAQPPWRLPPRDDGRRDAEFTRFRDHLRAAVEHKSAVDLAACVAADIDMPMSGLGGRAEFLEGWMGSESSWADLASTLALGTIRVSGGFGLPYLSWSPSGETLDEEPFSLVVIRRDAALRSAPDRAAGIVEHLRWDILQPVETLEEMATYAKVRSARDRVGYVEMADVRSPISTRALFERRQGQWKMVLICAGI